MIRVEVKHIQNTELLLPPTSKIWFVHLRDRAFDSVLIYSCIVFDDAKVGIS